MFTAALPHIVTVQSHFASCVKVIRAICFALSRDKVIGNYLGN